MPGPKAPQISLSPDERQGLAGLIRAHKTPQHLSFRARSFYNWRMGRTRVKSRTA